MAEPSGLEPASKPQISLIKPPRPGSGLMWAGAAVTLLAILAGLLAVSENDDSAAEMDPAAEAAEFMANLAFENVENATQAGFADREVMDQAVAASSTVVAVENVAARAGTSQAPDPSDTQTVDLNGVAITFANDASWQLTGSGRQVMLLNSGANVICQLTARNNATPGGIKQDAAGDEAGFEASYMASVLPIPDATQAGTLLFREEANGEYRYGVHIRVTMSTQAQSGHLEFVNAVAENATHMARMQCAPRNMQLAADLTPASALAGSLHVQ